MLLFFFTGCGGGSGSKTNTSIDNTLKYSSDAKSISGFIKISVNNLISSDNLTRKVKLSDFYISTENCDIAQSSFSPNTLNYDSLSDSIKELNIQVTFNLPCSDANITLNRTKTIYNTVQGVEQSPTSTLESSILTVKNVIPNINTGTNTSSDTIFQYALSTSSNQISISNNLEEKNVNIYLYKNENGFDSPVANKEIDANFIQPIFGTMQSYKVLTDNNGKASFIYKAPTSIKDLNSTTLKFYLKDDTTIQSTINLQFNESNTNNVNKIYLLPSSFEVLSSNEEHTIKVLTVNNNNVPIRTHINISSLIDASGNNYGTLSTQSIDTNTNGEGNLIYTSPNNLNPILDTNKTITFTVNNTNGTVIQNQLPISFKKLTADSNVTNYKIDLSIDSTSIKINDSANLLIKIYNKDDNTTFINNANVNRVNLTSNFPNMLKFDINSIQSNDVNYSNKAQNILQVDSFSKAGIAIIHASATIFDGEKNVTITQDFSTTIMSGPIRSLSLVYVNSNYNNGLFYNHYIIHAIDKYGNPANKGENIYAGVVNGLELSSKDNKTPLYFDNNGTLNNETPATFLVHSTNEFGNVVAQRDRLIILANDSRHDSTYLGGWSIQTVDNNNTLTLGHDYNKTTEQLAFVIGSEDRANTCQSTLALADVDSQDNSYRIGDNGIANLTLRYDPYLVGKDVYMYANAYTINGRVGTSIKEKLDGTGISATSFTCIYGEDCKATIKFTINDREGEALQNVAVPLTYEGGCQESNVTVKTAFLGCSGTITTEVNTTDSACKIYWNNTIYSDVNSPTKTIYYPN